MRIHSEWWSDLIEQFWIVALARCCILFPGGASDLTFTLSRLVQQTTIDDIFLMFPRKQDLTFHANCLHNSHEISNPVFLEK